MVMITGHLNNILLFLKCKPERVFKVMFKFTVKDQTQGVKPTHDIIIKPSKN